MPKNAKIFLAVEDEDLRKPFQTMLIAKGYHVVEDIANAEEEAVDIAMIGLNNYQGKLLAEKLRGMIPGIKVIPVFSDYVDYGDINTVCTDVISRMDDIIADILKKKKEAKA